MRGSEFKAIREKLDLTQDELAEILCRSGKQAISNIETDFRNAGKLSAVLMKMFIELPEKQSLELRRHLKSFAESYDRAAKRKS